MKRGLVYIYRCCYIFSRFVAFLPCTTEIFLEETPELGEPGLELPVSYEPTRFISAYWLASSLLASAYSLFNWVVGEPVTTLFI
jgi:hypothetical protein